jgi:hypothetical protein
MRLTDAIAATLQLPPGKADALFWDDAVPGFGIRIRASGVRTWVFQYKAGGYATRRLTIGRLGAVRAARAREIAGEYHAQVRLGRNPSAEKRAAVERSRDTFGALARLYLESAGSVSALIQSAAKHARCSNTPHRCTQCRLMRSTSAPSHAY